MKVLITGGTGQLGYDTAKKFKREKNIEVITPTSSKLDITKDNEVKIFLNEVNPDIIIHCAAYTNVDSAESEFEKCTTINVEGTSNLTEWAKNKNIKFVYISTDYVFDGEKKSPYEIDDNTHPIGVYGQSKLYGENLVKDNLEKYYIIRTSWVFGNNGNNFVKTMLRLAKSNEEVKVVADQFGAPTYTSDLAQSVVDLCNTEKYGTYHITNDGFCSWAEFAETIFEKEKIPIDVIAIPSDDFPTKAVRPKNSRLANSELIKNGFSILPPWQDALDRFLIELNRKEL